VNQFGKLGRTKFTDVEKNPAKPLILLSFFCIFAEIFAANIFRHLSFVEANNRKGW